MDVLHLAFCFGLLDPLKIEFDLEAQTCVSEISEGLVC